MGTDYQFKPAPTDGVDFSDAWMSRQYQESNNQAIKAAISALARRMNEPREILMPDGQTLANWKSMQYRRGQLFLFHGTWDSATKFANDIGGRIADGRNGTPPIHPSPSDSTTIARYLKATVWGASSGTTGGDETHGHSLTICDHTVAFVAHCAVHHCHGITGKTTCDKTISINSQTFSTSAADGVNTVAVASGSGTTVPNCNHYHCVDISFTDVGNHAHDITGIDTDTECPEAEALAHTICADSTCLAHCIALAAADTAPPYCTVIVIMKV